jgi:hypothetical protein
VQSWTPEPLPAVELHTLRITAYLTDVVLALRLPGTDSDSMVGLDPDKAVSPRVRPPIHAMQCETQWNPRACCVRPEVAVSACITPLKWWSYP